MSSGRGITRHISKKKKHESASRMAYSRRDLFYTKKNALSDSVALAMHCNHSCTRTQKLFVRSVLCSFDAINEYLICNKYRLFIIIPILFAVACSAIVG